MINYETFNYLEQEYFDDNLVYMNLYANIIDFEIKIFEDYNKILAQIFLYDNKITFRKKMTNKNEFLLKSMKSNMAYFKKNDHEIDFLTELHNNFNISDSTNQIQSKEELYLNFFMDKMYEKSLIVNLNNKQINYCHNLLIILKTFFIKGYPIYDNFSRDIPNGCINCFNYRFFKSRFNSRVKINI